MEERLFSDPREIKFGGEGKAEDIKRGFAITTLRNPKSDYNFERGERIRADCFNDDEKVPVVIITNEIKQLKTFSIPQLALDGFFSVPMVIDGMRSYPGYEKIRKNSIMQAITLVKEESFNALSQDMKDEIMFGHFDELIKIPELRHLFFPTMCSHFSNYGGITDWSNFLDMNNLVSDEERLKMENYEVRDTNMYQFLRKRSDLFRKLPLDPSVSFYRPLVLGLFD